MRPNIHLYLCELRTLSSCSDIVFESSASEGAILTMPRGARSEDLRNKAAFREYTATNIANWYRYANGPRGLEAKNGEVRLVVGFDKATSWGIATFANQTQQDSCRLKFGPSIGSTGTYQWLEYSGGVVLKAKPPDSVELRINTPSDVQFENQCLFVRTLQLTLAEDVWADIQSTSGSIPVDPEAALLPLEDSTAHYVSSPLNSDKGEKYVNQHTDNISKLLLISESSNSESRTRIEVYHERVSQRAKLIKFH